MKRSRQSEREISDSTAPNRSQKWRVVAIVADNGPTALAARYGVWSTSDSMGPGAHVAGLVGAALWVAPRVALRLETGPWWRFYRVREGATVFTSDAIFGGSAERDVTTRLLTWLIQVGVEWAPS